MTPESGDIKHDIALGFAGVVLYVCVPGNSERKVPHKERR